MHYLYILKSNRSDKYYVGETSNIEKRIENHKLGKSSFGRRNKDLQLVYKREVANRGEAKKLESFLKKQKNHQFIDRFIAGRIIPP